MTTVYIVLYFVVAIIIFNILQNTEPKSPAGVDVVGSILWLPMLAFVLAILAMAATYVVAEFLIKLPFKTINFCLVDLAKLGKKLGKNT